MGLCTNLRICLGRETESTPLISGRLWEPIGELRARDSQVLSELEVGMSKLLSFWDFEKHLGTILAKWEPLENGVAALDLRKCVSVIPMQFRHVSVVPLWALDGSLKLSVELGFKAPANPFRNLGRIAWQVEARAPIPPTFGHDPTNFAYFRG